MAHSTSPGRLLEPKIRTLTNPRTRSQPKLLAGQVRVGGDDRTRADRPRAQEEGAAHVRRALMATNRRGSAVAGRACAPRAAPVPLVASSARAAPGRSPGTRGAAFTCIRTPGSAKGTCRAQCIVRDRLATATSWRSRCGAAPPAAAWRRTAQRFPRRHAPDERCHDLGPTLLGGGSRLSRGPIMRRPI